MATIGNNSIGDTGFAFGTTMTRSVQQNAYRYTATTGDTVTSVSVYGSSTGGTGTIKVGVYVYNAGTDLPTTRVGTATVTLGSSDGWNTVSGLNIALTNGVTYVVALGEASADHSTWYIVGTGNERSGADSSGTLTDPWTHEGYSAARFSAYATVSAGGAGVTGSMSKTEAPDTMVASGTRSGTVSVTLVDHTGAARTGLTGLRWAFWDQSTPDALLAPVDKGTGATTDGSGVFTVSISHSTLATGQVGMLAISDTSGGTGACNSFFAPVAVS